MSRGTRGRGGKIRKRGEKNCAPLLVPLFMMNFFCHEREIHKGEEGEEGSPPSLNTRER